MPINVRQDAIGAPLNKPAKFRETRRPGKHMEAQLITSQWLKRIIEVADGDTVTRLVYSGRGLGSEKVMVNASEATGRSNRLWFVPCFEVNDGEDSFVFQVRIWPWLTLRSLAIEKNGVQIYCEGTPPYPVSQFTEAAQVFTFTAIVFGPALLTLLLLG